jgi:uncharacterized protein (TIGR02246 family)
MITSSFSRLFALAVLFLVWVPRVCRGTDQGLPLSPRDEARLHAVLEKYRTGWLSGNADKVRSSFTEDAVLMPHHGLPPVVGMAAINEFWFGASSTKTTITKFAQTLDELTGEGTLAYVRGKSEVAWTVEDNGKSHRWRNAGNFLAIFKKHADGKWLISRLIWDDPPNQQID